VSAVTAGPFASRSQAAVNEVARTLDPETSDTFEGGLRVTTDRYRFGATAFLVNFDNRLLAVTQGPGIVGNAPILSNVGGVQTKGLELVGDLRLTDDLSLFASYTFNHSRYQDDVVNRAGVVQAETNGKRVVNTPQNIIYGALNYDNGSTFASVSASYLGPRFFTFTNDGGKVPGRTVVDANFGYRLPAGDLLEGLELQLNVTNLLDEEYVGTLGTNGFVNAGDSQTLVTGAPRQFFVTVRKAF
jgi:iron complex outermembrane receptor protein